MAATPLAHVGKPKEELLHVRNSRNVQVSPTSPTPAIVGPSQGTILGNERFHRTRSDTLQTPSPLTSLSLEAAAYPSVFLNESMS